MTTGKIDDAQAYLRSIPFAIYSLAELCTKPGSYEREIANRVAKSVRSDIDRAIELLTIVKEEVCQIKK